LWELAGALLPLEELSPILMDTEYIHLQALVHFLLSKLRAETLLRHWLLPEEEEEGQLGAEVEVLVDFYIHRHYPLHLVQVML